MYRRFGRQKSSQFIFLLVRLLFFLSLVHLFIYPIFTSNQYPTQRDDNRISAIMEDFARNFHNGQLSPIVCE